jgi:hypothetical protein
MFIGMVRKKVINNRILDKSNSCHIINIYVLVGLYCYFDVTQRYYVLNESPRDYGVLRSYTKTLETAWGTVPIQLKSEFPISKILSVSTRSKSISKGNSWGLLVIDSISLI